MSANNSPSSQDNRWLYRCEHGHAHEIKASIRKKFSQIEQLRLEGGFGAVNNLDPGEWNWVPEAEAIEQRVYWIKVKDMTCKLPSDDEIQQMCSIHISQGKNESRRNVPMLAASSTHYKCSKSVGREARNMATPLMNATSRPDKLSSHGQPEFRGPETSRNPRMATAKTGILSRASSVNNHEKFIEKQPGYCIYKPKQDDNEPEVIVVTMEEGEESENISNQQVIHLDTSQITQNMQPGIHRKNGDESAHVSTESIIIWVGLNDANQITPIYEDKCLLEEYKTRQKNQLPQDLTLLTYFFKLPIRTYKKNDETFYKDVVSRYVPIIKVKISGKSGRQYDESFIVDIGSDKNVAPQYGFSKRMTQDIVFRSFKYDERESIQLRWRNEKLFETDESVCIKLMANIVGSEGRVTNVMKYSTKLSVARSFDMSSIVLGYNFIRPFIPAVDFVNDCLYFIHREEENLVMRFDIEKWVVVEEVINRTEHKVLLKSSATRLKLYKTLHTDDRRWYPIRSDMLEEIAPSVLTARSDISKLDACNTSINIERCSLVPEDKRYSFNDA